ncbi:putative peptidoglycan hydrolase [Nocardia wallacei]|uniref:Putative peptidoglycan hydrolase n=1 Tax=Nocardia wallacei TaxID=480035 RepID=A0A7G1KET8_9NOCA|nr:putative peptidoglycan hydrolase [Nocardia wallacei]
MGTLLDYAGAVPSADAIREAGHVGVIRYVSDRRPGAEWMAGKPLLAGEVEALRAAGLSVVSCYQYGKGPTADWRGGLEAGKRHAERGLALHSAAGGPEGVPIYASIDDNPSAADFATMIAPYLAGWRSVLGNGNVGVYANAPTIELARAAGLGSWFWQHDWGTPEGVVHPAANLHQFEIDERSVGGVGVDVNAILTPQYGQWW